MISREGGKWKVDIQIGGRSGRRVRRSFDTKAEALRFVDYLKREHAAGREWNASRKDSRRLLDLIHTWYEQHGVSLRSGKGRYQLLQHICTALGNPLARSFTTSMFSRYRQDRLEAGVSPNTTNHELAYVRALFNELIRLGEWSGENPVRHVRQIKLQERELSWLNRKQIVILLDELKKCRNQDGLRVTKLCLATGARWSEAEQLTADRLLDDRVVFSGTKSGRVRVVPIATSLCKELRVKASGRLFSPCYSTLRGAMKRTGIELPVGQMAHVLRHTFASHFLHNGGDILTLQRVLGHSDIKMTMRYAHLAPDHLEQAVRFNPLGSLS